MSHFDELPYRDRNHKIEDKAVAIFQMRLEESGAFILQGADRKDYGTDCQIEVVADERATNARVHVQLKGTESTLNADGSFSVEVRRANLNYLLMQPYSVYVAYHAPTGSLRIRTTESVTRQYKHGGKNWTDQRSLTVSFVEELTVERLRQLADLARAGAQSSRDRRVDQVGVAAAHLSSHVLEAPPDVHVPEERALARKLLAQLYEKNADETISAAFTKFEAVLGASSDGMSLCYMSEINLGMDGMSDHPERIKEAIRYFRTKLADDRYHVGDLHYTIGNAFHAIGDEQEALRAFTAALVDPALASSPELAAQVHQNLGSSHASLGNHEQAMSHYREALRLNPDLAEAHNAIGIHHVRLGNYEDALWHFDQVIFSEQMQGRTSAVAGWRANVLFNLEDGRAAFREIYGLVAQADRVRWIWPWCRRLVASFGRVNVGNARQALPFWQRYVKANPEDPAGKAELLMATFYLRGQGESIAKTYSEFREEFDRHIPHIDADNAALLWDRLGHWAQDDDDWREAERCFRKAYELAGGDYGYCLAIALNKQERFDESVPLLREQAQTVQPDAMSWFQLASAYDRLRRWSDAIEAYETTLKLDPDHAAAMFNLGGTHWNSGDAASAVRVWTTAIEQFPDHELSAKLKRDLPLLFSDPSADQPRVSAQ
ncbi:tetratricopeptide repeat protein [Cupriavidus sp. UGS-1]|uniref:tetratricopeptide repeat protein n=1 Tax=Cupriavidus sp. UGS-1 TaxID=2899826 RepID=UPI001E43D0A5|nr:tetratricopeptide repeat protein [Cupriavidus sp. UGS-1]MCD9122758.1 tetratricopeptide repeat protein [Cupriavidus sp. UGS-1]